VVTPARPIPNPDPLARPPTLPALAGLTGPDELSGIEKLDSFQRERLSEPTRTLLCDFAAGDLTRPLHRVDADWEEVFQGICRNGLIGLTHAYFLQQQPQDYPPPEFRERIRQAHGVQALRMQLLYADITDVLARLTEAGLDYLVVKGPAVAHTVYPDPTWRSFTDLDLVVRERAWAEAHRLLVGLGLSPDQDQARPPPKLIPQLVSHGSHYRGRDGQFLVEAHYDDLLESGLAARDVEGFWRRAAVADIAGIPVKVLSLEDQLIQLSAHVHHHGYSRLNWLSDLAFIVRDHAERLDWERLLRTVRVEEAQVATYYSLKVLNRLLAVEVPANVLVALRPDRFRRRIHEYYMPQEKVLSLQPMPLVHFSFYFKPLFRRLLPSLLVMGRRREKLRCLLKLMLPDREWLRYYYHLGDTQNVTVHYMLHPLKLTYHYLEEIMKNVSRFR
jgi:hypothetical protein